MKHLFCSAATVFALLGVGCSLQPQTAHYPPKPQLPLQKSKNDVLRATKPVEKATPKPLGQAVSKQPPVKITVKKGNITEAEVEQVFALREAGKAFLIDTRPPIFYKLGHIAGAQSVPLKYFEKSYPANEASIMQAVSEGKTLVVYCANETCVDSYKMSEKLAERGLDSSVFKGGWELWKETGIE